MTIFPGDHLQAAPETRSAPPYTSDSCCYNSAQNRSHLACPAFSLSFFFFIPVDKRRHHRHFTQLQHNVARNTGDDAQVTRKHHRLAIQHVLNQRRHWLNTHAPLARSAPSAPKLYQAASLLRGPPRLHCNAPRTVHFPFWYTVLALT